MLKMVKYMAKHAQGDIRRLFVRFDKHFILHASILGQFFDVVIWLLNMDEKLAQHRDMNGMRCLQLLSYMPLVFRSQATSKGAVKNLIYYFKKYVFKHPQPKRPKSLRIYESHIEMSSPKKICLQTSTAKETKIT
ncbi:1,4-alpha-glucan-branching enzyme 1, chloroplastic/amyloplastic [Glycine max]|nr:1,4-alpha-glucan-branching enzyme 1, chloroplastic/amyloplastic [Glycine max]